MDLSFLTQIPGWIIAMLSLKANGVTIDCSIEKIKTPGSYHLALSVHPGRKETFFTSLKIPHCEISNADWEVVWNNRTAGYEYQPDGPFFKESIPVKILRPSKKIQSEEIVFHFIVRPLTWSRTIEVSLSYGGWFSTVTSKHYLL